MSVSFGMLALALNGPWTRALQPGIPDTGDTIVAEGIAYDGGGPQTFDWQVYARIIEGIRAEVDIPVHPAFPALMSDSTDPGVSEAEARFNHIDALRHAA
jgi:3-keto-5-aminohexanoate cleavage enzyme